MNRDVNPTPWWGESFEAITSIPAKKKSRSILRALISAIAAALVFFFLFFTIRGLDVTRNTPGPWNSVMTQPSSQAILQGCGNLFAFDGVPTTVGVFNREEITPTGSGRVNVPTPPMLIPVYGYMENPTLDPDIKFYSEKNPPAFTNIMRSMYDGTVVIWYGPSVNDSELEDVQDYANTRENVVLIPWNNYSLGLPETVKGRGIPSDRDFAYATWQFSQSCQNFDPEVVDEFLAYIDVREPVSDVPEARLDKEGKLPPLAIKY